MGKEEIFDYVMETPGNTNPNVLRSLLDSDGGSDLPPVTPLDNGKVLAVEDGAWAASNRIVSLFALLDPTTRAITADNEYGENYSFDEIANMVYAGGYSFVLNVRVQGTPGTQRAFVYPEASFLPLDSKIGFIGQMTAYDSIPIVSYDIRFKASDSEGTLVFTGGIREKEKFIVTLTPTSPDFSGTMDKTVAEINAAYEAGQQIVFRTMLSATEHMDVDCTARWFTDTTYPSFNGFILNSDSNVFLFAFTGATNDGTRQAYGTVVYPLTRAS